MSAPLPVCYLNGAYLPLSEARISPLDRAFLFGDAVYEVIPMYRGRAFRLSEHLDRLTRSLAAIRMPPPLSHLEWSEVFETLIRRNGAGARDVYIYLQVTRGAEMGRNHSWPAGLTPTLFAYATALEAMSQAMLERGVAAITAQESRWARRDIKSTALLANVLLKKLATDVGAFETIMLEQGFLTEGSSTTVHVVIDAELLTPPNGYCILPGTTRDVLIELATKLGIANKNTSVSESSLRAADEIWLGFATRGVVAVSALDGKPVGTGEPGPIFKRVHSAFSEYTRELAATPPL